MTRRGYLTILDIVTKDFLHKPQAVIVESGNGTGKTHSAVEYAVELQKLGVFDRIYIAQYSQKGAENVINKIRKFGGWAVWHVGFERHCPLHSQVQDLIKMGIPPSYICYQCKYFRGRSKAAFTMFEQQLQPKPGNIIRPVLKYLGLTSQTKTCTHPILRSYVLDPTLDLERRLRLRETPIIVVPVQIFLNHGILGKWYRFSRRQRRDRKTLLILDEADTVFFSSLKTEVPEINPVSDDYDLLRKYSPKSRNLGQLIDLYLSYYNIIKDIHARRGQVTNHDIVHIKEIIRKAEPLLRSFDRRRKLFVQEAIQKRIKTNVFRIVSTLEELTHIENLPLTLKTVEQTDSGYILYDYEYGIRLLFDPTWPWRFFWKINLSATFPTEKIVESQFVSSRAKRLILSAKKRTKGYQNVFTSSVTIFEKTAGVLNRNAEIPYSVPKILEAIKRSVKGYEERFRAKPGGVCIWFGNSKQMREFLKKLREHGIRFRRRKRLAEMYYRGIPILISYVGSTIARGLDLDEYDISIVVGPLLRPPRTMGFLDVIDFGRGVAEAIQAAMRVVRNPVPPKPKLVVLESHMTTAYYSHFYPEWFKQLFIDNYIEI